MKDRTFYIVDVFAERKYSGNQLAVVTESDGLSHEQMQQITCEMHFSETTFICSDKQADGGFAVRIFTPGGEVPFAGHPSLGTAFVLSQILKKAESQETKLNLQVGQIPVTQQGDLWWMTPKAPQFGRTYVAEEFAPILSLDKKDFDPKFPIQIVSTGLPFVMVPLKNLDAVKRIRVQKDLLLPGAGEILVFAPETHSADCQLNVRVFVPRMNIPEDPATGSANSCLAGYLSRHRYFGTPQVDIQVEQGLEIERPSRLHLKSTQAGGTSVIQIGGKVQLVAKGTLL